MAEQQRYFLDLGGLKSLWNKIKSSFADKEATESSIYTINDNIDKLDKQIQVIDNDVNNLENTVLTIAPREVNYYSEAIELSKSLAVGTMIKINYETTSAEDNTPSGYSAGIYVVLEAGKLQYISTSDGNIDDSNITKLSERVTDLENTVVKTAEIIDENGKQLGQNFSATDNVLLIAHDDTFDIDSESVRALTHRAVAAKFKNIESILTKIPKFKIKVVDELPTSEISLSTIYLLKNSQTSTNNLFTEYIYVEVEKDNPDTTNIDESKFAWEKLGEQTLIVDDIITTDQLNNILSITLSDYAKKTDVNELINTAKNEVKLEVFQTIEDTYATKTELEDVVKDIENITGDLSGYITKEDAALTYLSRNDAADIYLSKEEADQKGWVTEADVLASIQTGNIGNSISITEEQIEQLIKNN